MMADKYVSVSLEVTFRGDDARRFHEATQKLRCDQKAAMWAIVDKGLEAILAKEPQPIGD